MRDTPETWTRTTCPYCGVGCGVLALAGDTPEQVVIQGDPEHPANFGKLCSKGSALGETMALDDRLLTPMIGNEPASWPDALDLVARRFSETIAVHGPDSVAFYVSGQILTEDYYVANKLMKGFIGSANIDTNSRLCMASSVAGHKRAFGSDTVPGTYEDLELADLVVLVGSNLAWCHPVLYQRLAKAREERGTKVVVIDPRETATCDIADLHLALKPGSDVALFNGLLNRTVEAGVIDPGYIERYTSGFENAVMAARELTFDQIVRLTGLSGQKIVKFYELFLAAPKTVTVYSQGVNQSSAGTDKVNAILNCHLATGRIGEPGCGPFSVTGQPNAMGGREVGGLANMLAAHMELGNADHRRIVQSFWGAPRIAEAPGLKAVELFEAVGDGRIKAIWIMATNPVDSLPHADAVRDALVACPFVVVSDVSGHTDTTAVGDVLLPAAAWGEKDGTVTNSERRISRQRAFLPLPHEARPDWWQICEVAKRMGFTEAFSYAGPAAIFAEHAALTGAENDGSRDFDISAHAAITQSDFDALAPFQWPQPGGTLPGETRFFANGQFFTADRKARFIEMPFRGARSVASLDYPLILNTGRIRDQWHTMTRTAKTPRLTSHYAEPFVEIHPTDAVVAGIGAAELVVVESPLGRIVVRAALTDRVAAGTLFAPMHWTSQFANAARVGTLIASHADPHSGQPELKYTPVRISHLKAQWYGFLVGARRPDLGTHAYVAIAPVAVVAGGLGGTPCWRAELADTAEPADWILLARELLGADAKADRDIIAYCDAATGQHRFAAFDGDRCAGLFFAGPAPVAVSRTWAIEQVGCKMAATDRFRLLAGRPGPGGLDKGPVVCACFEIGRNEIVDAIATRGCRTVDLVGAELGAGTNCGTCRSEIGKLIHDTQIAHAD